jgi:hypothetical protein
VLLELLLPLLLPSLPPLLLLLLVLDALLVASMILLPDLNFFRNLDFSILRNGGQALMDGGQALCHNLILKSRNMFNGERTKFGIIFVTSGTWLVRRKQRPSKEQQNRRFS